MTKKRPGRFASPPPGAVDPVAGDVLAKGARFRRVIGVLGGGVVYSNGGDKNHQCKLATWQRWARGAQNVKQADA